MSMQQQWRDTLLLPQMCFSLRAREGYKIISKIFFISWYHSAQNTGYHITWHLPVAWIGRVTMCTNSAAIRSGAWRRRTIRSEYQTSVAMDTQSRLRNGTGCPSKLSKTCHLPVQMDQINIATSVIWVIILHRRRVKLQHLNRNVVHSTVVSR